MSINLKLPDIKELKPKITVFGVGGAGGNAVNNMIRSGLEGVEFVVANTDSQALMSSQAQRRIQMGVAVTEGLGAGSMPEIGRAAAEEVIDEITDHLSGAHMIFVTAGMGGGTGTGAAPVIARAAREHGILTVGVVTKPFQFEGARRMRVAEAGIADLQENVDTLIVIPNQNLFRIANDKTTFADAFAMADQVLFSGVACITDLMVKEGLINLDFADVRSVMREMGKAMMGTGEASGERRAQQAAEAAIANPLLDETSMAGAKGLLISITGGRDLTLFEVDEAATRIREEVDPDANIILGATFDENLEGVIRVSVVATGIDSEEQVARPPVAAPVARTAEPRQRTVIPPVSNRAAEASRRPVARATPAPAADSSAAIAAAAVAAAVAPDSIVLPQTPRAPISRPAASDPDVHIAPLTIQSAEFAAAHELDPEPQAPIDHAHPDDQPFIPPAAEAPASPRMPRVDQFPEIVQRQLAPKVEEGNGPMSLLKRLAPFNLGGRREEHAAPAAPHNPAPPRQAAQAPAQRPAQARPQAPQGTPARAPQARPQGASAAAGRPAAATPTARPQPGMYRPVEGNLDPHGRTSPPRDTRLDDGELEIPAFLRRQAN
ncbi:MAG: cell division protein FtsZ [Bauldia sp.]|nr:cell division protein FtsZ [Bauldia sp.]